MRTADAVKYLRVRASSEAEKSFKRMRGKTGTITSPYPIGYVRDGEVGLQENSRPSAC